MRVTPEQREAWRQNTAESPFNRWLDSQVRDRSGRLDVDKLHALARRYGVEREAAYLHLNPGQQRMNIGNILRRVVPIEEYAVTSKSGEPSRPYTADTAKPSVPATDYAIPYAARPETITSASVRQLLTTHGQILDELRARKIVRTSNGPAGDYAELLFARAFGWTLAGNSASGHDAVSADGVRYQIKSRRLTPYNGSRQLSALRLLPDKQFDHLAAVLFNSDYSVFRAVIVPHGEVERRCRYSDHVKAWIFMLEDATWSIPGAQDVTVHLTQAAADL